MNTGNNIFPYSSVQVRTQKIPGSAFLKNNLQYFCVPLIKNGLQKKNNLTFPEMGVIFLFCGK